MLPAQSYLLKPGVRCPTVAPPFPITSHGRSGKSFTTHEWKVEFSRSCVPTIRATIRSGDKNVGARTFNVPSSDSNGSLSSSGISVQAVVIIKKKMKEKLGEKLEDQVESFFNGIGQGIVIQLVSEEIDPGMVQYNFFLQTYKFFFLFS